MRLPTAPLALSYFLAFGACQKGPATAAAKPAADVPVADGAVSDLPAPEDVSVAVDAVSPPADLASVLEPLRARHGLPALAAMVTDGRRVLAEGATGRRAAGDEALVQTDDRWHLGSCTKAMTATLFARLAERAVVRWETPLAEAFPDLAESMHASYRGVTLEQLMQHRGGMPGEVPPEVWSRLWRAGEVVAQRSAFAASMLSRPPANAPGSAYLYSNAGYMVVGAALERATGRPWEELLRDEVFAPLAMRSCGFGPAAAVGAADQPLGHRRADGGLAPVPSGPGADNPAALGPAGTVHCSLEDWSRFAGIHLRGARAESTDYLSAASFTRMHAPPAGGDYALGWGVVSRGWAGGRALNHNGSNTMFLATVWVAVARGRVLLVATNAANDDAFAATEDALGALISAHVP